MFAGILEFIGFQNDDHLPSLICQLHFWTTCEE